MIDADSLPALNERHALGTALRFGSGAGGLVFARIDNAHAQATICLQGAHVTHWQPRTQAEPVLWLSPAARYAPGTPIRGGIPVCWPWFGPAPAGAAAPAHGFARTQRWGVQASATEADGATRLQLHLHDTAATRALWPQAFALELHLVVGATLEVTLLSHNTGDRTYTISEALHSYFRVGDIGAIGLEGLEGAEFTDTAAGARRARQHGAVRFAQETDRVYDSAAACTIDDPLLQRRIHIEKWGSASTVVWTPWDAKAARLGDLGEGTPAAGAWRGLLCVESANALAAGVALAPGQRHALRARYRVLERAALGTHGSASDSQ